MQKIDGETFNNISNNIEVLKQFFPDVVSEGKVDFKKLQLLLGNDISDDKEKFIFSWKGKNDAIKISLAQNTGTLRPDKKSSKNWDTTKNLYIEGDNLEVLRTLQDSYRGQIKMIYIDPPYNTGKDFVYKDNFHDNVKNYTEKLGENMKSNPETNGRYHTDWLNMMYPRLKLARNLLKDDGVIFMSIDDNEVHNLRKICDEIFGEDNFVSSLIWRRRKTQANLTKNIAPVHDFILAYAKNKDLLSFNKLSYSNEFIAKTFKNPDNDSRGSYQTRPLAQPATSSNPSYEIELPNGRKITSKWSCSKETFNKYIKTNKLYIPSNGNGMPRLKIFLNESDGMLANTWLDNLSTTEEGSKIIQELFDGKQPFDFPKPIKLIMFLLNLNMGKDDVVLDFFSGSATTAHATMNMNAEDGGNRKFIMVQLPETTEEKSEAYKIGYKNICEIGKERIRRAGKYVIEENKDKNGIDNLDTGFKVFKLDTTNLKKWETTIKSNNDNNIKDELQARLTDMTNPVKEDREQIDMIYEIMLKNGMDLSLPMKESKIQGRKVFNVASGYLIICLEKNLDLEIIKEICDLKPKVTVFYDESFKDDVVKLNAIEQLEKQDIQVRVI